MSKYSLVSDSEVIEKLSQGEKIVAVDRLKDTVYCLDSLTVKNVFFVINMGKIDDGRIIYYTRLEENNNV